MLLLPEKSKTPAGPVGAADLMTRDVLGRLFEGEKPVRESRYYLYRLLRVGAILGRARAHDV